MNLFLILIIDSGRKFIHFQPTKMKGRVTVGGKLSIAKRRDTSQSFRTLTSNVSIITYNRNWIIMILFLLHLHGCVTSDTQIPTQIPDALYSEIRSNLTFNNSLALNGVNQNNSQFSQKERAEFLN